MKIKLLTLAILLCCIHINAQCNTDTGIVNIPDAVFKSKLVNNTTINTNLDGEISCDEALAFTGMLDISFFVEDASEDTSPDEGTSASKILDVTGIEVFTQITGLNLSYNNVYALDVYNSINLTSLNMIANPELKVLETQNNTSLQNLNVLDNDLRIINVTKNTALETFNCSHNTLTSLDVTANTALTTLISSNNPFSENLDIINIQP